MIKHFSFIFLLTFFISTSNLFAEKNADSLESSSKSQISIFDPSHFDKSSMRLQDVTVEYQNDGTLRIKSGTEDNWPGIHLSGHWDLSNCQNIVLQIENPTNDSITLYCRLDCEKSVDTDGTYTASKTFSPLSKETWKMPLPGKLQEDVRRKLFAMRGKPGGIQTDAFSQDSKLYFDKGSLTFVRLFETKNGLAHEWILKSIASQPEIDQKTDYLSWPPEKFFPMIDQFGQFKHKEWPGKIHSVEEMRKNIEIEAQDLKSHSPQNWTEFGGWKDGPKFAATGHFRTEKIDGIWSLIDPTGALFWSNGVDCISTYNGLTPITDREFYFENLPEEKSPFAQFYGKTNHSINNYYADRGEYQHYNFTASNLLLKYGEDWRQKFIEMAGQRLRSWGLNTVGNWSDWGQGEQYRTPYTATIGINSPRIEGSSGYWGKFVDPFHPEFRLSLEKNLKAQQGKSADDPFCIGYFVDNEISWGDAGSLAKAAMLSPKTQPVKSAMIQWLKNRYDNSIEKLNAAWNSDYSDWDYLLVNSIDVPEKAKEDCDLFYSVIAEKYFEEISKAIKTLTPNKLYLGCRFAWTNELAQKAAGKFCDVVSYNFYKREVADFQPPEGVDKPCIIGEFHFGALDRGLFHPGLGPCSDQNDRARAYENYVKSALKNPYLVGAHWFQYGDQATTGRFDGENYQIGLIDICDTPYPETIQAIRNVGYHLYEIRYSDKKQ
ncbi:MAG: hypothetical protein Q4C95_05110 [Planctomycetia bacterium]|nr:hypothetical protein [Planctomycetia bacterium]